MEIGISLGSNLGDRLANLKEAKRLLGLLAGVRVTAQSRVYETSPVDVPGEFEHLPFLNSVLLVETAIPPVVLLGMFNGIENTMGRERSTARNAPRPIDIDIIFAGHLQVAGDGVTIPHPRWAGRRFVVEPLNDVRPDMTVPGQTGTVRSLLSSLPAGHEAHVFTGEW
ncbi:MAG: 2-amino-4-hydroxy-6-hydroxymethyldihydropteridine diphosphokinase [bacterium]